jgi:hypothetical protein
MGAAANAVINCSEFSQYDCFAIGEAVAALSQHSDPVCNDMAEAVLQSALHWDEYIEPPQYGYAYLGSPTIWLGPHAFSGNLVMEALAHEAAHTLNMDDDEAYPIGWACSGSW